MRVAIVHDLMDRWGGSEGVAMEFLKMFPGSDLYTLMVDDGIQKRLGRIRVRVAWFAGILRVLPVGWRAVAKLWAWRYWDSLDLRDYDLIICSSHSYGCLRIRKKKPEALHVAYVHSPPKYLYMEKAEWEWIKKIPVWGWLRKIDEVGAKRPDVLVANSAEVRGRIEKYYGRKAIVIYPPVKMLRRRTGKGKYYLFFSRLTKQKGVELAVRTANKYGFKLVVAGNGPEKRRMIAIAGPNVEFVGVEGMRMAEEILAGARALIYPAIDEDFGIVPVEAMSAGVPTRPTGCCSRSAALTRSWSV